MEENVKRNSSFLQKEIVEKIRDAYDHNPEFKEMVDTQYRNFKEHYEWLREDIRNTMTLNAYMKRLGVGATYETFKICGLC